MQPYLGFYISNISMTLWHYGYSAIVFQCTVAIFHGYSWLLEVEAAPCQFCFGVHHCASPYFSGLKLLNVCKMVTANGEAVVQSQCFITFRIVYHVSFGTLLAAKTKNQYNIHVPYIIPIKNR